MNKQTKLNYDTLKIIKKVHLNRWSHILTIVDGLKTKDITILEKEYFDDWKKNNPNYYPLNLNDINTWSTQDRADCIYIDLFIEKDKLFLDVDIREASFFSHRIEKIFTAKLEITNLDFINNFQNQINWNFDYHLDGLYEDWLDEKKKNWKNKKKVTLLNKSYGSKK